MITFMCRCSKEISISDDLAGREGRCPSCRQFIRIPGVPTIEGSDRDLEEKELVTSGRTLEPHLKEAMRYMYFSPLYTGFVVGLNTALAAGLLVGIVMWDTAVRGHGRVLVIKELSSALMPVVGMSHSWPFWMIGVWACIVVVAYRLISKSTLSRVLDLYARCTRDFSNDLVGFAKAAGFELSSVCPFLAVWAVCFSYALTAAVPGIDVFRIIRNPWLFVCVLALATYAVPLLIAKRVFTARPVHSMQNTDRVMTGAGGPGGLAGHLAGAACFTTDGSTLATGGQDGMIRLWHADVSEAPPFRMMMAHIGEVAYVAFSGNGKLLITAGRHDKTVNILATSDLSYIRSVTLDAQIVTAALSPESDILAIVRHGLPVLLLECRSGKSFTIYDSLVDSVECLTFSPDGSLLVAGSTNGTVRFWSVPSGQMVQAFVAQERVVAVALSPGGEMVVTASEHAPYAADGIIQCWNRRSAQMVYDSPTGSDVVRLLRFSPDGEVLAATDSAGRITLREVRTGEMIDKKAPLGGASALWFDISRKELVIGAKRTGSGLPCTVRVPITL
jgi:hypothetical protein